MHREQILISMYFQLIAAQSILLTQIIVGNQDNQILSHEMQPACCNFFPQGESRLQQ